MKKKTLKSLKLNKKSISSLQVNSSIKRGKAGSNGECVTISITPGIISWAFNCNETLDITCTCITDNNENTCHCTVA